QALIEKVQAANVPGLSGTIELTTHLGLPDLGSLAPSGSGLLTSLLSGSHSARVWFAGPDKVRIAIPGDLSETDIVRNGTDLWQWQSQGQTASHLQLSPPSGQDSTPPEATAEAPPTPAALADQLLASVDPTTRVFVRNTATVAGRPAYELVLAPKAADTLVADAVLTIDAGTGLPLKVQVLAKDATTPALDLGFTSIDLSVPGDGAFQFSPPSGATVRQLQTPGELLTPARNGRGGRGHDRAAMTSTPGALSGTVDTSAPSAKSPSVVGEGWNAVAVIDGSGSAGIPGPLNALVRSAKAVSGTWGSGRLIHTTLFNVLVRDRDGKILVGSVTEARLQDVAASQP
ncbi:MAG: hypothetical protein QOG64_3169, partial [Acidimicrobiaceae bacterium]|nr:hypothetical protein [Acidimicrobiaceae bacterium]